MSEFKDIVDATMAFSAEMLARLETKKEQGWKGWDWDGRHTLDRFRVKLVEKANAIAYKMSDSDMKEIDEKECVDLANYAMFLWNIKRSRKETP